MDDEESALNSANSEKTEEVFSDASIKANRRSSTDAKLLDDLSWVLDEFQDSIEKEPDMAHAMIGVKVLIEVLKKSKAATFYQVKNELSCAAEYLNKNRKSISLTSGIELFTRFVTRTSQDREDFDQLKEELISRGQQFVLNGAQSRTKIVNLIDRFIGDDVNILTHGYSKTICEILINSFVNKNKRFNVIVAEGSPVQHLALKTQTRLNACGIGVSIIADSIVGHVMERIDLVLVPANALVESGGIINQVGTFQIGILAKSFSVPFYVAAESFKFTREYYPLKQQDVHHFHVNDSQKPKKEKNSKENPLNIPPDDLFVGISSLIDYTPPSYISLVFTDLGILTPSGVSDELIKLYYS